MKLHSTAAVLALGLVLYACQNGSTPSAASGTGGHVFRPPSTTFAGDLGITGPVTSDQAKAIAAAAAGGTALTVEQEDEDGTQVFGVIVQTTSGNKDVKVRISDGAVTKIDADDGTESGSEAPGTEK
jgi:uncharacterized membrane protein YkoI